MFDPFEEADDDPQEMLLADYLESEKRRGTHTV
jgi:hypothetical protein